MMKKYKVEHIPECPRCHSPKTGMIEVDYGYNIQNKAKYMSKALLQGHYVKYVDPNKYRSYYKAYNINMFCYDCNYEFFGESKIQQFNEDEYNHYIQDRDIKNNYLDCIPYMRNRFTKFFEKRKQLKEFDAKYQNKK